LWDVSNFALDRPIFTDKMVTQVSDGTEFIAPKQQSTECYFELYLYNIFDIPYICEKFLHKDLSL